MIISSKNIPGIEVGQLGVELEEILGSLLMKDVPSSHVDGERGRVC